MPKIARVRLPDGRVARFRVPDDATPEQILAAAKSKAAPKREGGIMGALNNVVSSGNELLIGAAEGAYNAASAITDPIAERVMNLVSPGSGTRAVQGANRIRRQVVDAAEDALVSQPNPVARTTGRIAGAIAVPVPKAAQASRLARTGVRAIQGAVGGAAVREVDESAAAPAATGAVVNMVVPPILSRVAQTAPVQAVGRAIGKAAAPVVGAIDNAAEAVLPRVNSALGRQHVPLRGTPAPPPQSPLAPLGVEAEERAARFRALGVDEPTTGMVTRDPAAFSFEQNVARVNGVGDRLAQQIRRVEQSLVNVGENLHRRLGGARDPEATGKLAAKALDAKRNEMQQATSALYRQVRAERGDQAVGRLDTLRERMTDPDIVDNAVFDQMREGIVRRMTRLGLVGKSGSMSQPVTIRQAEELRKFIGGLGNNMEPGVRMMRARLIDALDDDVVNAVGDDAFKAARASAKARFDEFQKTFAGKVADEKLAPEALTRRILGDGVKLSELRAMRQSLTTGTKEQVARGREAWRALQGQSVNDLLSRAVDPDGNLVGTVLWREFSKNQAKYREILGPQDFKLLQRLAAATRDAKAPPVGHSVNTSNTAVTLANLFDTTPAPVREGWARLLGKIGLRAGAHVGAAALGGPAGNIAVEGARAAGSAAVASRAEQKAAEALMNKIRMAQSPEATAAAIRAANAAAKSRPGVADALNRAGFGVAVGGTAAAPQ